MRNHEIEAWAYSILERIRNNQPIEDSRVELKAEWPKDISKAARRIAGHGNAVEGPHFLWLIGVDEKQGVTGVDYADLAQWQPQIHAQFDGVSPRLTHLNIPVGEKSVAALLFEADRKPYVVKNPEGRIPHFEVPWREATSIKTANRENLLRILSPLQALPSFELHNAWLDCRVNEPAWPREKQTVTWRLRLDLYVIPGTPDRVVIPFRYCESTFHVPDYAGNLYFDRICLSSLPDDYRYGPSQTITGADTEVIIDGPGTVRFEATIKTGYPEAVPTEIAIFSASIRAVNSSEVFPIEGKMHIYDSILDHILGAWCLNSVPENDN